MMETLQTQRDGLQREVAELQGQLSQEKSSRSHATDLHQQLEGKQTLDRPASGSRFELVLKISQFNPLRVTLVTSACAAQHMLQLVCIY